MITDDLVLRIERLRDSLEDAKKDLRSRYKTPASQVTSKEVRAEMSQLAEFWMVEVAARADIADAVGQELLAELNIEFQRLLTYPDQATVRKKYDTSLNSILREFRTRVVIPLKQRRVAGREEESTRPVPAQSAVDLKYASIVFIGQSFVEEDKVVNELVRRMFEALGFSVVTGEKASAARISDKVRRRIESSDVFVGIFTRREKIARKREWSTSSWVIDEKAFALAQNKKLLLIKEAGVSNIGGLQGDYEYLEFDRTQLGELMVRLVETYAGEGP